jgi:hypothetical protein
LTTQLFYQAVINMMLTIRIFTEEGPQFGVIGTDDIYTLQCFQAIGQLRWGAEIRDRFPHEKWSASNSIGRLVAQRQNVINEVNAAQRGADEMEGFGP